MHVKTKKIALAGLLAALAVILLILSSVIESSSLFFIAAASFCVGIAIREWGVGYGALFFVATILLGILLAPNKMYCLTFAAMSIYLLGSELIFCGIAKAEKIRHRKAVLWLGKILLFNVMYIPLLLYFPALFVKGKMNGLFFILLILAGQVVWFLYDMAHSYMQNNIWGKYRNL